MQSISRGGPPWKGSVPLFGHRRQGQAVPPGAEQRHLVHSRAEGQGPPAQPLSQRKASQRKFPTWSQNWLPPCDSEKVLHKHIPEKTKYVGQLLFCVVIVQSLSLTVSDSLQPWTAARQASLSFTISWSLLKLMSFESVML